MYGGVRPFTSTEKLPSARVETGRVGACAEESTRETVPETGPFARATPVTPEPDVSAAPQAASAAPSPASPSQASAVCFFGIFMRPPGTLRVDAQRTGRDPPRLRRGQPRCRSALP